VPREVGWPCGLIDQRISVEQSTSDCWDADQKRDARFAPRRMPGGQGQEMGRGIVVGATVGAAIRSPSRDRPAASPERRPSLARLFGSSTGATRSAYAPWHSCSGFACPASRAAQLAAVSMEIPHARATPVTGTPLARRWNALFRFASLVLCKLLFHSLNIAVA
jgi:hypothetical protein